MLPKSRKLRAWWARTSGVRSDTIPGYRFTSPVRGWDGQQLHRQLAESQRLVLHLHHLLLLFPLPSIKLVGVWGRAPAAAKPPCLLLLTQYRLIVTSNSGAASIAGASPFAGRPPTLPRRASIGSIASRGIARTAVPEGRSGTSMPSAQWRKPAS